MIKIHTLGQEIPMITHETNTQRSNQHITQILKEFEEATLAWIEADRIYSGNPTQENGEILDKVTLIHQRKAVEVALSLQDLWSGGYRLSKA